MREIHKRNLRIKKAASTSNPLTWKQFKDAQNETNNSIKKAKLSGKLDANKGDPVKLGVKLMSFSLSKVTKPECSEPKQETKFYLTELYCCSI